MHGSAQQPFRPLQFDNPQLAFASKSTGELMRAYAVFTACQVCAISEAAVQNSRCSICPYHTACQFSAQPILNANMMLEAGGHIPLAVFAVAGVYTRPLTEDRLSCR